MPYESKAQAKLMRAVAHGWQKPGGGGPSVAVAKKFGAEDKQHPSGYAEGGPVKSISQSVQAFAQGGPVLGRTRDFIKTEDRFRGKEPPPVVKTDEDWSGGKPKGRDKSLTPVKPRS